VAILISFQLTIGYLSIHRSQGDLWQFRASVIKIVDSKMRGKFKVAINISFEENLSMEILEVV
jgi:hypothetical protein